MSADQINQILENFSKMMSAWSENTGLDVMRRDFEAFFSSYPETPNAECEVVTIDGVPCERVSTPGSNKNQAIILLHGGGFSMGSARSHRSYATHLSAASEADVFSVDYRLTPEHIYPAALEDTVKVFNQLTGDGFKPQHISICGDSAGAGLALALLLKMRDSGHPQPASCVLVSPWADMLCEGKSYIENEGRDPIATKDMAIGMGAMYLGEKGNPRDPYASPVNADLKGLPPVFIVAGDTEVFLDDARTIEASIRNSGGDVTLNIWPEMIHQWPLHAGRLDEADDALRDIGAFIQAQWAAR